MPGERISNNTHDSVVAAADLTTHQFKAVKLTSTGIDVAGANEAVYGVLQNDPNTGQAGLVLQDGPSMLVVNGNSVNIAAGDYLEATTGGIGIKSTADKKNVFAQAREAAAADGVHISVSLVGPFQSSL